MKARQWLAAAVLGSMIAGGAIQAQDDDQSEPAQQPGSVEHQERQRAFLQQSQQDQARLLEEARERLQSLEARSDEIEERFNDNRLLLENAQGQLDERLGPLSGLFGTLQQAAADARAQFQGSRTNIQYPGRIRFLDDLEQRMRSPTRLPSLQDMERLWYELQREATALGQIQRMPDTRVVSAHGEEHFEDVVRVGDFNLVADGRYLSYNPATGSIAALQRQPGRRFTASTSELVRARADDGFVDFGLDVTRGELMSQLIASPTLVEQIQQGRAPGYVIIALGILGLLIGLERLITLTLAGSRVRAQLEREEPSHDNPLGRVLVVARQNRHLDTQALELRLGETLLTEIPPLQRGIQFIKIIAALAPLLGLLGTVFGMIVTFQSITLFGTGDPGLMADGISTALVTTVLGLTVAVPMVLLHAIVNGRSREVIQTLQEQVAGIVADQAEQEPRASA